MKQNDRIIHIPRRFLKEEWGGTETLVLETSKYQQQRGWRPEVFTSLALAQKRREIINGVSVRRFSYFYPYFGLSAQDRLSMDKKGGNLVSFSLLAALMKAPDVRLFHAHAIKRLGGEVRFAARLRGKPYVVTLHGGVFDVPKETQEKWTQLAPNTIEWGKPLGALFGSRRVLIDADHVLCVGEGEFEKAKQQLPHDRISFLPNAVDPGKFRSGNGASFRSKHGIPGDALLILNISRIDAQKNQLVLLEAFARLRSAHSKSFLLFIGPVTQAEYAQRLESGIQTLGLSGVARILPGLHNDDPDLVSAYHACDVFVLPSVHEPFGIVVLEAWCCGKPVVTSPVGGLKTLVKQNETGLVFDSFSSSASDSLAHCLGLLAADPVLRGRLGKNGFQDVMANYQWSVVGKKMESLYAAAEEHARQKPPPSAKA